MIARLLAILVLATSTAQATDGTPGTGAVMQDIPPAEWRRMVQGRTVTYMIGELTWANERYDASGNGVSIQLADGTCMDGFWYYQNQLYCFAWSLSSTSCFRHTRLNEQILIIPMEDGVATGNVQTLGGVSDTALNCSGELTS